MVKYTITNLFPSTLHIFDTEGFDEFRGGLVDYVYKMREQDPKGFQISNRHGWQSKGFVLSDRNDLLHSTILQGIASFPSFKNAVQMTASAWININPPGAYNLMHDHPNVHMSGVMWIKSPKDGGVIEFLNPNDFQAHTEINCYTDEFKDRNFVHHAYWIPPLEGRMVIFPSHLKHSVGENMSNEDRISVSFNINLNNSEKTNRFNV